MASHSSNTTFNGIFSNTTFNDIFSETLLGAENIVVKSCDEVSSEFDQFVEIMDELSSLLLLDEMDFTDFNATELMVPLTTTKLPIAFNNCSFSNVAININKK